MAASAATVAASAASVAAASGVVVVVDTGAAVVEVRVVVEVVEAAVEEVEARALVEVETGGKLGATAVLQRGHVASRAAHNHLRMHRPWNS